MNGINFDYEDIIEAEYEIREEKEMMQQYKCDKCKKQEAITRKNLCNKCD